MAFKCDFCGEEIKDPAYVKISGQIILQGFSSMPNIFKCKEHAENYARTPNVHADCWILLLKEIFHLTLHDMTAVLEEYKKQHKKVIEAEDDMEQKSTTK